MTSVVLLDVVPGTDGGLQLVSHHHAWALGGGASNEQHHTSPCVGKGTLGIKGRWKQVTLPFLKNCYLIISHLFSFIAIIISVLCFGTSHKCQCEYNHQWVTYKDSVSQKSLYIKHKKKVHSK